MSDVVVTVPKGIWTEWVKEGDAAGEPWSGERWGFYTWGTRPDISKGERVYVVAHGRLRGYAPLEEVVFDPSRAGSALGRVVLVRAGGAVAVTVPEEIRGFRGCRRRWWDREAETPFPDWATAGVGGG